MTNIKLKLGLSVGLALALFLGAQAAMATDIIFTGSVTVSLTNPAIDLTITSGSKATSLVVDTGSISVVVPSAEVITITSTDRDLSFSGDTTSIVSSVCTDGTATATVTGGGADETITITPTANTCSSGGGGGGGGGGAAAGEEAVVPAALPSGITLPYAHPVTATEIRANINTLQVALVSLIQQLIQMLQSQLQGL